MTTVREIGIILTVAEEGKSTAYDIESNLDDATEVDLLFLVGKINNELQYRLLKKAISRQRRKSHDQNISK